MLSSSAPTSPTPSSVPELYVVLTVVLVCMALVPTLWPALDLAIATWFAPPNGQTHIKEWWWVAAINLYVPSVFRGLVYLSVAAWAVATWAPRWKQWRLPLAYFILSGALGPGLLVNSGFKEHWQRARPYEVENFGGPSHFTRAGVITDQCNNNCAFVSGHVACGVFFASLMLVHQRRRRAWAVAGCAAGVLIGFSRMADMAHWLSDALWAAPITWVCSWLVWRALLWAYRPGGEAAGPIGT